MKFELIHADGCTTNLGVLGAGCNCGAEGQLEADKKVVERIKEWGDEVCRSLEHGTKSMFALVSGVSRRSCNYCWQAFWQRPEVK